MSFHVVWRILMMKCSGPMGGLAAGDSAGQDRYDGPLAGQVAAVVAQLCECKRQPHNGSLGSAR